MEKKWTKTKHFWSNFDSPICPEESRNRKKSGLVRKNVCCWAKEMYQNQGFISSPLSSLWPTFTGKQSGVLTQSGRIKVWQKPILSTQFLSSSCKKILVPTFSNFGAIYHKGHFRKILTQIFKFTCFSSYNAYVFEKNELVFLMKNLMLNRLAPILNDKKEKACLPFYSETNLIN